MTAFRYVPTLLLLLICSNCKSQIVSSPFDNTIQFKKGNYWVFDSKTVRIGSNSTTRNNQDSTFIKADTMMNGSHFYRIENSFGLSEWKRDSSGCIVNENGDIEFCSQNNVDTLLNNNRGLGFMGGKVEQVTVPAGTFTAIYFYIIQPLPAGAIPSKNNPTYFNDHYAIVQKVWYANNIGVVKSVVYYGAISAYEKSLVRFKINNL